MNVQEYLKSKIIIDKNSCWLWKGYVKKINAKRQSGYALAWHNGKNRMAHRLSYTAFKGRIPDGLCVCHHCDVKHCINPDHLFLGTQKDNIQDMFKKGRQPNPAIIQGEKNSQAKLTEKDIYAIFYLRKKNQTGQQIADIFNISKMQVSRILNKQRWKYLWD